MPVFFFSTRLKLELSALLLYPRLADHFDYLSLQKQNSLGTFTLWTTIKTLNSATYLNSLPSKKKKKKASTEIGTGGFTTLLKHFFKEYSF